jgi:hypothetical protein
MEENVCFLFLGVNSGRERRKQKLGNQMITKLSRLGTLFPSFILKLWKPKSELG